MICRGSIEYLWDNMCNPPYLKWNLHAGFINASGKITYFPQKVHAISGASEEKNDIGEISQRD